MTESQYCAGQTARYRHDRILARRDATQYAVQANLQADQSRGAAIDAIVENNFCDRLLRKNKRIFTDVIRLSDIEPKYLQRIPNRICF